MTEQLASLPPCSQSDVRVSIEHRWMIAGFVIISSMIRILAQLLIPGFLKGDDLEIVEDALAPFAGFDTTPWAIRNLFVSRLVVRPWVSLANGLGFSDIDELLLAASIPFILASAINIVLVYTIGRRWAGPSAALTAAMLYAFHWVPLVYGTGGFPRPIAVTFILLAVLLIDHKQLSHMALSGLLVGAAFAVRYSEIVMVLPLVYVLIRERAWKRTIIFVAGVAVSVALLSGWYEWLTWGAPFRALRAFADFTLIEHASSSLERYQPAWWYLGRMHEWAMIPALVCIRHADRRLLSRCVPLVLIPLLVLSTIHHKEVRYLQMVVPFAALIGGSALARVAVRRRIIASVLLVLTLLIGIAGVRQFERRSSAATLAAQWIGTRQQCVAISQAWAYGGRLYLRRR